MAKRFISISTSQRKFSSLSRPYRHSSSPLKRGDTAHLIPRSDHQIVNKAYLELPRRNIRHSKPLITPCRGMHLVVSGCESHEVNMLKRKASEEPPPAPRKVIKLTQKEHTNLLTPHATPVDEKPTFLNIDFPSKSPFSPDRVGSSSSSSPSPPPRSTPTPITPKRSRRDGDHPNASSILGRFAAASKAFWLGLAPAPAPMPENIVVAKPPRARPGNLKRGSRKSRRSGTTWRDNEDDDPGPDIHVAAADKPSLRLGTPIPEDFHPPRRRESRPPAHAATYSPSPPDARSRPPESPLPASSPPPPPTPTLRTDTFGAGAGGSPALYIKPLRPQRAGLGGGGRNLVRAASAPRAVGAANRVGALVSLDFAMRRLCVVPRVDVDAGRARDVCVTGAQGEEQGSSTDTGASRMGRTLGTVELDYEVVLYGARVGRPFHVWDGLCRARPPCGDGGGKEEGGRVGVWDFWKDVRAEICLPDVGEVEAAPTMPESWELW